MTIQECYTRMGADYEDVLRRLEKEDRVKRFLSLFPNEGSYALLWRALESRNAEEAFRAAHSLKGVCVNLGLTALYASASALTEALRERNITPAAEKLAGQVTKDYSAAVKAIQEYLQSGDSEKAVKK